MELSLGICIGIAAIAGLLALGRRTPDYIKDAREEFYSIHGRYPTADDYEDPIA